MDLTPEQQLKVDKLLEAEKRGILGQRPDLEDRLRVMRERGIVAPSKFDLADKSPLPFDEKKELIRATPMRGPNVPERTDTDLLELRRARAEAGIVEDSMDIETNLKLGLSLNPTKELKNILDKKYKSDVPIRYDRNTGRFLYVNPENNRITTVGMEGLDVGDVGRATAETPVIVGDVAGTIAGGAITGVSTRNPALMVGGEAAGSAIGTYIGEVVRLSLGKLAGVNKETTIEDIHDSASKKAQFAGAATGVAGAGAETAKSIVNFIKGRTFTREAALRSGLQSQEADQVLAEINNILEKTGSSARVELTTGKRTGDALLLGDESVIRREKDYVRQFIERDKADINAITEAFDNISPVDSTGSRKVIEKFGSDKNRKLAKVTEALDSSAKNLEDQLNAITPAGNIDSGNIVRKAIEEKRVVVNNKVNAVNNQWKKLAGANKDATASQVKIPVGDNTQKFLSAIDQESRDAIFRVTSRDREGLFSFKKEEPSPLKDFILPKSVREELSIDKIGNKPVDLIDYQRAISDIRATIRAADKGESVSKGQQTILKRALSALVKDRDNFLRKSNRDDVFFAVKNADVYTRQARDMLDRSMIGDLMRKQGNRFKVRSQDVFDSAFVKGGDEQSAEIFAGISTNHEAMKAWRTEILNKYRREVYAEGRTTTATAKAHNKFMDDYRGAMRPFFSRNEMALIDRAGGLVRVVEKQEKQYQRILKVLNGKAIPAGADTNVMARTRATLTSLDPEEVVPWVTSNRNKGPGRARRLVSLMESSPAELEAFRAQARLEFRNNVMPNGKTLDPAAFDRELKKNSATYKELFGEQYVNDLFTINDTLQLFERKGSSLREPEMIGVETALVRAAVAPPLTREGRMLTAFMRFRGKTARDAIARSLLNPDDLNEIARLSVLSKTSREAAELAGSLGLLEYVDEDTE